MVHLLLTLSASKVRYVAFNHGQTQITVSHVRLINMTLIQEFPGNVGLWVATLVLHIFRESCF